MYMRYPGEVKEEPAERLERILVNSKRFIRQNIYFFRGLIWGFFLFFFLITSFERHSLSSHFCLTLSVGLCEVDKTVLERRPDVEVGFVYIVWAGWFGQVGAKHLARRCLRRLGHWLRGPPSCSDCRWEAGPIDAPCSLCLELRWAWVMRLGTHRKDLAGRRAHLKGAFSAKEGDGGREERTNHGTHRLL